MVQNIEDFVKNNGVILIDISLVSTCKGVMKSKRNLKDNRYTPLDNLPKASKYVLALLNTRATTVVKLNGEVYLNQGASHKLIEADMEGKYKNVYPADMQGKYSTDKEMNPLLLNMNDLINRNYLNLYFKVHKFNKETVTLKNIDSKEMVFDVPNKLFSKMVIQTLEKA